MQKRTAPTLPTRWYIDPEHHARELKKIWMREWLCVGHASEFASTGSFRVVQVGRQRVVITRTGDGQLNAFHNTCRHRGSELCATASGRFENGRVVCPYHGWVYSLNGELTHTPRRIPSDDFAAGDYSLYPVALACWRGFVFINLARSPAHTLAESLGEMAAVHANWPLEDLVVAHQEVSQVQCNWKVFWENYVECLHCPGVHKDLVRLVPVYGLGFTSLRDLPWEHPLRQAPGYLAPGVRTWSGDGQTPLPELIGLDDAERAAGMTFAEFLPSMFLIGHLDYVRSVHILPLGPEQIRLTMNWLLPAATLASENVDIERLTAFARQVVNEDQQVCELNQRGLHCQAHEHGVLTPQEYDVLWFDNWVRRRLDEPEINAPG